MFKKQESLINDVVGGAAIGVAVGMIMEKVLSPRTPIANSSTYGMHSPVQWQFGSNQLQYIPTSVHCHRVHPSPCKYHKEKHHNNFLHSEYEDSYINHKMSSSQSSRTYDTIADEYTASSKEFPHIPYDSTKLTSLKTRTSTTVALSKKTDDSLTTSVKSTIPKKQDPSQSNADASKKQSIKDKSLHSKSNISKKENIKKDLTIPTHKQKVNTVNESSVRNCGCAKRNIDKAHTDLPKKDKVPPLEIFSKSKTVHYSKNEFANIRPKVSTRSQGVKESVNTSKIVKAMTDLTTETSKSEVMVKSSKKKTFTEKSKHHGIKSSTILDASSFSQTKDLKSLSETGNLATYHLTNYIDLEFTKTETSCSNIQNEKENIRDLLEFW